MEAPLSSPTRQQAQRTASQWPQSATTSFGAVPPPPPPSSQHHHHHHHHHQPAKTTPSTEALLKDFSLVAEAAKRAQMAVVMRDLGDLGLS